MTQNVYLASGFSWRFAFKGLAIKLEDLGYNVCSRWIWLEGRIQIDDPEYPTFAKEILTDNIEDLKSCDILVADTDGIRPDGNVGAHYEIGFARALEKRIFIVGDRISTFHWEDCIAVVKDYEELLEELKKGRD